MPVQCGNTIQHTGLMRVVDALILTLTPLSQMIPNARYQVAPLAVASRRKDLDDPPAPPFRLP
jgi:hypothetical protein